MECRCPNNTKGNTNRHPLGTISLCVQVGGDDPPQTRGFSISIAGDSCHKPSAAFGTKVPPPRSLNLSGHKSPPPTPLCCCSFVVPVEEEVLEMGMEGREKWWWIQRGTKSKPIVWHHSTYGTFFFFFFSNRDGVTGERMLWMNHSTNSLVNYSMQRLSWGTAVTCGCIQKWTWPSWKW